MGCSPLSCGAALGRLWPTRTALLSSVLVAAFARGADARPQDVLTDRYRDAAARILGAALVDQDGWRSLEHLTTRIGHRLSGSEGLERAIAWAVDAMRAEGLDARARAAVEGKIVVFAVDWMATGRRCSTVRPARRGRRRSARGQRSCALQPGRASTRRTRAR